MKRKLTTRQQTVLDQFAAQAETGDHDEPRVVGWRGGPVVQTETGHVRIDRHGLEHDLGYDELKGVDA